MEFAEWKRKIYQYLKALPYVKAITSSFGSQTDHANYMLNSKTNTICITGEENFSEFIIMSESETAV